MKTAVLVIGAGPAGSAAAIVLASAGIETVLADQHAFPRDKVCGDGLIPDALRALRRLGAYDRVVENARMLRRMRLYAPGGACVALDIELACVPRARMDESLRALAVARGAVFLAPCRFIGLLEREGRVAGARFADTTTDGPRDIEARFVVLATGASAIALANAGVALRRSPSGVAARRYYRLPAGENGPDCLCLGFIREILPGYGWVFPGPDGLVNVGVGVFGDRGGSSGRNNLRRIWERFTSTFEPARDVLSRASPQGDLRGAPLRCGLAGARFARDGLLVAGEAAGTTYSFSGEGIGKALETGAMAGNCLADHFAGRIRREEVASGYENRLLERYRTRFDAYRWAQVWLGYPWLYDLLARRANRAGFASRQLRNLLEESGDPRGLFSPAGILKAMLF